MNTDLMNLTADVNKTAVIIGNISQKYFTYLCRNNREELFELELGLEKAIMFLIRMKYDTFIFIDWGTFEQQAILSLRILEPKRGPFFCLGIFDSNKDRDDQPIQEGYFNEVICPDLEHMQYPLAERFRRVLTNANMVAYYDINGVPELKTLLDMARSEEKQLYNMKPVVHP